jgi:hypothetical protein
MQSTLTYMLGAALMCGCASEDTTGTGGDTTLIDNAGWALDEDQADDTHPAHRPEVMDCNPYTVIHEEGVLELDTRLCGYFVVSQPSLFEVAAGDSLLLEWSHLDLDAPEPAEAHLAIAIDGELQWETTVAIPNEPNAYDPSWTASRDFPVGSRVTLHLHNHGINSWRLHSLSRSLP